jgi:hypothetical protein
MLNNSALPISDYLHLLLSCSTDFKAAPEIGTFYAKNMLGGVLTSQEQIPNAWADAGTKAYKLYDKTGFTNTMSFAVAGWPACFTDTSILQTPSK